MTQRLPPKASLGDEKPFLIVYDFSYTTHARSTLYFLIIESHFLTLLAGCSIGRNIRSTKKTWQALDQSPKKMLL